MHGGTELVVILQSTTVSNDLFEPKKKQPDLACLEAIVRTIKLHFTLGKLRDP